MKKILTSVIVCFVIVISTYSQTKQELIKELFHIMQKDSIIDRTMKSKFPVIVEMAHMEDSLKVDSLKAEVQEKLVRFKEVINKLQGEEMTLYDKKFTQNEIKDLIAFYKTPTGQKFIKCSTEIQGELQLISGQKYMQEIAGIVLEMKKIGTRK
jgi:hypothetical protein